MNINPNNLSLEETLLLSALLCGVNSETPIINRLQLFYCGNFMIGKDSAEEDFQRCIETEVDKNNELKYWVRADRAIYELTSHGYKHAKQLFPNVSPMLSPAHDIDRVSYKLFGQYNNQDLILERRRRRFIATVGNQSFANINDACRHLGLNTTGRSAPRILYNLAIRNKFKAT